MFKWLFQQYPKRVIYLLAGDILLITISMATVIMLSNIKGHYIEWAPSKIAIVYFMLSGLILTSFYVVGLYDPTKKTKSGMLLISLSLSLGAVHLFYSALSYFIIMLRPGRILMLIFIGLTGLLIFLWREIDIKLLGSGPERVLLIGNDKIIRELAQILQNMKLAYKVAAHWHRSSHNPTLPSLFPFVKENQIDTIIYSVHSQILDQVAGSLCNFRFEQHNVYDAHSFYQRVTGKFPLYHVDDFWLLVNSHREFFFPRMNANFKRVFDILCTLLILPVAVPLMLICAVAVKLSGKGPVFFIQERLGRNEVPFKLIKLRTMIDNAEEHSGPRWSEEDDPRITWVGRILRKLRMDELPQLINVLTGEMSLVGPRPIRRHFADLVAQEIPYFRLRFLVKPGLTGWAQVSEGYSGSMEGQKEKLQYDLFYLMHQSLVMDLLIVLKTIRVMLWARGT